MTRVKICGITSHKDAYESLSMGADAIGFVFADSPRKVSPAKAKEIIKSLGPWAFTVGVFVNETPERILRIAEECRLSAVQLHGDESPGDLKKLKSLKRIKALRVADDFDITRSELRAYETEAFLFDTKVDRIFSAGGGPAFGWGGTGKCFNWKLLDPSWIKKPFIISGGLNPENVGKVIKLLSPYGVDVSSGVEKAPGKKNLKLVKTFIRNAKK